MSTYVEYSAEEHRLKGVQARKDEEQAAIEKHQKLLVRSNIWRTCLNCSQFVCRQRVVNNQTYDDKHCSLFQMVPPPHVILHGCREWEGDIPF